MNEFTIDEYGFKHEPIFEDMCSHPKGSYAGTTSYSGSRSDVYFFINPKNEGSLDPKDWHYCCRYSNDCGDYASGTVSVWLMPSDFQGNVSAQHVNDIANENLKMIRLWMVHVGLMVRKI